MSLAADRPTPPDYPTIKTRQRQTWASGNYQVIASLIMPVSERLCDTVDLRAGESVLDVASGTGNTAIAAARRLCHVTGIDYVPVLLERAQARAAAESLSITFMEGDAEALPVPDDAYDVVLSSFGSMFSPNQERAAGELVRVCRSGGRIGLVNWTPEGWIGEMLRIVGRHAPPPAGVRPATRWGTEEGLHELLGNEIADLRLARQTFVWRFVSAQQYLDYFRMYYGPVLKAFATLDENGQDALARDLIEAVLCFNCSHDDTLLVPAEYMQVVATKK